VGFRVSDVERELDGEIRVSVLRIGVEELRVSRMSGAHTEEGPNEKQYSQPTSR
jgi:hypothetical protein